MDPTSSTPGNVGWGWGGGGVASGACGDLCKAEKVKRRLSRSNPVDVATAVELIGGDVSCMET